MEFKTCRKCGKSFPATSEHFSRDAKNHDGLHSWCKPCAAVACHAWYEAHREQIVVAKRAYCEAHKEERAIAHRIWVRQNSKHVAEYRAKHEHQCFQANPILRFNARLASAIGKSLRGHKPGRSWEAVVGYTLEDLMCHLERQFQPGMTWETYGKWHIDHRKPLASFAYVSTDDPEFRECWALSNLQPLWAEDNINKGARWSGVA